MNESGKDIYTSGRYVRFFSPEDKKNPFRRLYRRKREDVLAFLDELSGELKVLDVGGGMGRISNALAKKENFQVFLGDLSVDMLKLARKNGQRGKLPSLINLDAECLPLRESSFQIVVGLDLFCHLRSCSHALQEFRRVLRRDGILILDSTNANPLWVIFYPRYLGINPLKWIKTVYLGGILPGWERLIRHYGKSQFLAFLKDAGFQVEHLLNYGPWICPKWHLVIARKTKEKASS